jgi:hypothetical protein
MSYWNIICISALVKLNKGWCEGNSRHPLFMSCIIIKIVFQGYSVR